MNALSQATADAIRILMVEDNEADVELISAQMKRDGLDVIRRVVVDEHEFRQALAEFAPQLVLSDFSLPTFDGLSALRIARECAPDVPFVFVSGTIGEERAISALKSGAADYVLKENLRRLVPAIRSALRQSELTRSRDVAEDMLRRSESRLQDIVNTSADWIWECDEEGRFTFSSPSAENILGYARHHLLSYPASAYVEPADRASLESAFEEIRNDLKTTASATLCWIHSDGSKRWLERRMVALLGEQGIVRGFRGIDRDVTARVNHEASIRRLNRALRFLSRTNSAVVHIHNRHELLREACRLAVQMGGYAMATVYLRQSRSGDDDTIVHRAVNTRVSEAKRPHREPLDGDGPVGRAMATGEAILVADVGDTSIHVPERESLLQMGISSCMALPLLIDGTPIGVVLLHSDDPAMFGSTELALLRQVAGNITFSLQYLHSRESVEYLEYFDTLTALANRSLYKQRLDATIKAVSEDQGLTVLVFDVSGLTTINDGLGHHAGDLLLQLIAERMKNVFRDSNCLCHLGGGRYAVSAVCPRSDKGALTILRERVDYLFDLPFPVDDQELRISMKAGAAQFPEDGPDAEALLHHAQIALDHAKEAGEQYLRHQPHMNVAASERLSLTNRLRAAAAQHRFMINYQPKVDLRDGRIEGVEALLRWPESNVGPDVFVPVLESIGLIDEVSQWVLANALVESAAWTDHDGGPIRVAVNVSPHQLRRDEFAEEVLELLSRAPGGAARLELEVTESMLMADPLRAAAMLGRLRQAGVTIAIDDFGTGHSSLQVLSHLPVDVLKIDRSFVRGVHTSRRHRVVVQTTITLAKSLGIKTVAEGVETEQQMGVLAELGCDTMQGYFVLRPAPADTMGAWLADHSASSFRAAHRTSK